MNLTLFFTGLGNVYNVSSSPVARCLVLGAAFSLPTKVASKLRDHCAEVVKVEEKILLVVPTAGTTMPREELLSSAVESSEDEDVFLLCRQSKSRRLFLYGVRKLVESNATLREVGEGREGEGFVIPQGGVEEGLAGKAVLISEGDGK